MSTSARSTFSSHESWEIPIRGAARFSWNYDPEHKHLLALYQRGKDKQWDSQQRINWSLDVDPYDALGTPDHAIPLHGTPNWGKLSTSNRKEIRQHYAAWQFSQFLHGEQGAMIAAARIIECSPTLDAKFYAATQAMDEARHAEIYNRFLQDKIGLLYPASDDLTTLLSDTLSDSRWDIPYLGMQILVEGLGLAVFGLLRDTTTKPLPKQILTYITQDEARHVAFGQLALRDYYHDLSSAEMREREEIAVQGIYLMLNRFRGIEVLENFGIPHTTAVQLAKNSPYLRLFKRLLFRRIVPCLRDIGLWTPRLQEAYAEVGAAEHTGHDLRRLLVRDDELALELDAQRIAAEERARAAEVQATVEAGRS